MSARYPPNLCDARCSSPDVRRQSGHFYQRAMLAASRAFGGLWLPIFARSEFGQC
jgi:hypothetical protein